MVNKSRNSDDLMMIFLIVLNAVCVVNDLRNGGSPIMLALNAFAGGAALSGLVFNQLHKKAMKLCDQWHEAAIKAHDVAKSALRQSITIMTEQVDRYKRGE